MNHGLPDFKNFWITITLSIRALSYWRTFLDSFLLVNTQVTLIKTQYENSNFKNFQSRRIYDKRFTFWKKFVFQFIERKLQGINNSKMNDEANSRIVSSSRKHKNFLKSFSMNQYSKNLKFNISLKTIANFEIDSNFLNSHNSKIFKKILMHIQNTLSIQTTNYPEALPIKWKRIFNFMSEIFIFCRKTIIFKRFEMCFYDVKTRRI